MGSQILGYFVCHVIPQDCVLMQPIQSRAAKQPYQHMGIKMPINGHIKTDIFLVL